jgi:hypothetical protein
LVEENIQPVERPRLAIIDLIEKQSPDGSTVTLTGTLVNRGTRSTHEIYVRVHALAADESIVAEDELTPTVQVIAAGMTGDFTAIMENRPEVVRYHVEAFAR